MKNFLTFLLLILIFTIPAFSQEYEELTLSKAITLALKNNSTYKIAKERVKEAKEGVNQSWGMLWPSLSSDASITKLGDDSDSSVKPDTSYQINIVNAQFNLNPGAFYNSLKASREYYIAAESSLRQISASIKKGTIDIFYAALLAEENLKIKKQSLNLLKENFDTVNTGYRKGVFSRLDYLNAKVAYTNARTDVINAQNDYDSAIASLNVFLGYDINYKIKLVFSTDNFNKDELGSIIGTDSEVDYINKLIAEAMKNRPELIQKKALQNAYKHQAAAAASIYFWPTFFVQGNYNTAKTTYEVEESEPISTGMSSLDAALNAMSAPPEEEWKNSWSVTVGVTYQWGALSPFDKSHAQSKINKSKEYQTKLEIDDFVKNISLEVKTNFIRLKSARLAILSQIDNVKTAEESYRASLKQFRNGVIDNTKLLDANVKLLSARTMLIQAIYNYNTAKSQLNNTIGKDIFKI